MVMWENLEVHTSKTIEAGRKSVEDFGEALVVSFFCQQYFHAYIVTGI